MEQERRRVLLVFGTRPEAIKMAPVVKELQKRPDRFDCRVAVTGQHREMLDQVLAHFRIHPDHDLNVMQHRQTIVGTLVRALEGLDAVVVAERPDLVLVHGDTVTTVAGSLAAFYNQVPLGHVEAGLRSFQKYSPYPEEVDRRIASVVADLQFAPTVTNREHLLREGVHPDSIFVTGNTAIDALRMSVRPDYAFADNTLRGVDWAGRRVITVTAHRRENWGERHAQMFRAMRELVERYPDTLLIYPVHLGPAVREQVHVLEGHERILLLDPLAYPDMVNLLARSYLVLTDSGGLQEETPSLGVPLLLLRDTTERPEAVEAGVVIVVGTDARVLTREAEQLLSDPLAHRAMAQRANPYGDGRAAGRIAQGLEYYFGWQAAPPPPFRAAVSSEAPRDWLPRRI